MKVSRTNKFKKQYKDLPSHIQSQTNKQLKFLIQDIHYPSLRSKKMSGFKNVFEARVSKGYRMRYQVVKDEIIMLTVGPHDEGLGKK